MQNEIPLYRRRRDAALDVILAVAIGALLAWAAIAWCDGANWGLQ